MRRIPIAAALIALLVTAVTAGGQAEAQGPPPQPGAPQGEILVRFRPGTRGQDVADAHRQNSGQVRATIAAIGVDVVRVPPGQERAKAADYRRNPNVLFAEPNGVYRITGAPNDPQVAQQWQYNNTAQSSGATADADIDAFEAWEISEGDPSVTIAILDTGIDLSHEDLAAKVARSVNFSTDASGDDGHGHGTHVAGSAAAITNNGLGVAGVCRRCTLYAVKVMNNDGSGTWESIANGIVWAADNGAKVINLSIGDTEPSATIEAALNYAWDRGVVVVAGAGNNGNTVPFYPAAYEHAIAVAATDEKDLRASFSNYGAWVDVAAPGMNILSTAPDHVSNGFFFPVKYGVLSGTSMASPHVAGLAGLIWSSGLCSTAQCVRARIETFTDQTTGSGTLWSRGRVNACTALGGACTYNPMTAPPSVTVVKPAAGATVTGTTLVQINASDPTATAGTLTVEWSADGGAWQPAAYNAATQRYESTWNTTTLTAGAHTLTARATNASGSAASASVQVNDKVEFAGSIAFGGSATVTLSTANKVGFLRFSGAAGQRFVLQMSNVSIPSSSVAVMGPDGDALGSSTFTGSSGAVSAVRALPTGGVYTIVVDPGSNYTGSMTVTLIEVPPDATASITPGGPPVTVTTTAAYQNAALSFTGAAGQRISLRLSNVSSGTSTCCGNKVSIVNPDGSNLLAPSFFGTNGDFIDTLTLSTGGQYTIVLDPQNTASGSVTATLWNVPADLSGAVTPGTPLTAVIATPGQNARYTFSGTAGQGMNIYLSGVTLGATATSGAKLSVIKPDGTLHGSAVSFGTNGADVDVKPLPVSGTYTLLLDPQDANTGNVTLGVTVDAAATVAAGGPTVTVTLASAGQNARVAFSGTAGQRLSLALTGSTIGASSTSGAQVTVLKPDGTSHVSATYFGTTAKDVDMKALPVSGDYTIFIEGAGSNTGSVTLTLSAEVTGSLSVGGAAVPVTIARAGQNARLSFSGTAGQTVTLRLTGVTIGTSATSSIDLDVLRPDGTTLTSRFVGTSGTTLQLTLNQTGTYEIVLNPRYLATGSATLQLSAAP